MGFTGLLLKNFPRLASIHKEWQEYQVHQELQELVGHKGFQVDRVHVATGVIGGRNKVRTHCPVMDGMSCLLGITPGVLIGAISRLGFVQTLIVLGACQQNWNSESIMLVHGQASDR